MSRAPFAVPLMFFAVSAVVSEQFSYERVGRWQQASVLLASVALYFVADRLVRVRPKVAPYAIAALLGLGAASLTGYYLFGLLQGSVPTSFNANVVAGVNGFVLPFLLVFWQFKKFRALVVALGGVLFAGLLLAGASGAIVAWALVCVIGAVWWRFRPHPSRSTLSRVAVALPLAGAGLLLGVWVTLTPILQLLPLHSRTYLYRQSEALVMAHPFVGAGMGTYDMIHATYSLLMHVPFIGHAHNLYIDIAIAQGGVALLVFVCMMAQFFALSLGKSPRIRVFAAQLAILFLLLHGFVDNAIYSNGALLIMFVPFAFLGKVPPAYVRRSNATLALLLCGIIVSAAAFSRLQSAAYANIGAVQQAQVELGIYDFTVHGQQDTVRRSADLTRAVEAYEYALQLYPANVTANFRLGQIALARGDYAAAVEYLRAAATVNQTDNAVRQLLGEALIVTGQQEAGAALWQSVYQDQDQLEVRLAWYDLIGETGLRSRLAAAVPR